ncbi:MAG: DNA polymerase I [Clostridia bacterium]|nr:DNA polymerase I [Clostridia bacterium]
MLRIVLIDGNSLINRAFFATPALTNSQGVYTNAVYGFINMLVRIIEDVQPSHLAVAFDMRAKTFRHLLYDGYKATRKGMPAELASQMPILHDVLKTMGICILEQEGIEADDIIGTVAKRFGIPTVIVTGDRDALQLVDSNIQVYLTKRGITEIDEIDEINIKEKFGFSAAQVIEYKALSGDSSDNIPGVKGVGDKTALSLLEQYGNIDGVYESISQIKGKLKEKLEADREMAYLSRELATIKTDCNLAVTLADMEYSYPFSEKVRQQFEQLEFRSLLKRDSIFSAAISLPEKEVTSVQVNTLTEWNKLLSNSVAVIAIWANNGCYHVAFDEDTDYFPVVEDSLFPDIITTEAFWNSIAPFLQNESVKKLVFDVKGLYGILKEYQITLNGQVEDLAILKYLTDGSVDPKDEKSMLTSEGYPEENGAAAFFEIEKTCKEKIEQYEMQNLYSLECKVADVLAQMEEDGFHIDLSVLTELGNKYKSEIALLQEQIYALADEKFNINSPRQLGSILFEKLGLKHGRKTKTGYSTDNDVLEGLINDHEIIPLIISFRKLTKLVSVYIDGMLPLVDKQTGVVHTVFKQTLTTTGRLSSAEPNLQNIPVRTEEGKELRKMFVSGDENRVLVSADYSQIELRLLAHYSGDDTLLNAFNSGEDIHAATAARVNGISIQDVTPEMRRAAKAINFGIIYGISDYGLAVQLNITRREAADIIKAYLETYAKIDEFRKQSIESARANGYAKTLYNRRRRIPELSSSNYNTRSFGERVAMNMPLQGSAADLIKLAMVGVHSELKRRGLQSRLILQVHDELIVDTLKEELSEVEEILRTNMENILPLHVSTPVEINVGRNWYETK